MARPSEYKPEYCHILLDCLSKGMLDCEIYDVLDICKNTFLKWRRENPEFEQAYQKGMPKCEAWWLRKMREKWEAGKDKGFKYCAMIMNSKFNYRENAQSAGTTNNTQINVSGSMNLLDSKSIPELIDTIKDNFKDLQQKNAIPSEYVLVLPKSEENKDE